MSVRDTREGNDMDKKKQDFSMILINMSGTYEHQNFYQKYDYKFVNCTDIEGTNCYCEDAAVEEIKKRLQDFPAEGIHFLDSGNYHYLTLQWLDKIDTKFNLLHFDNHPDLQQPSFGQITSCGGWVQEALERNQYLNQVYMYGVEHQLLEELEPLSKCVHTGTFPQDAQLADMQLADDATESILPDRPLPIYISIDKDVLREEDAVTDWSQGTMTLEELLEMVRKLMENYQVIGIDICGESQDTENEHGHEVNNKTNAQLIEQLLRDKSK